MEIVNITPRLYQKKILNSAKKGNTLVILPTGLGKTIIALLLSIEKLKENPNSKILFLAPTKPLCVQHMETFKKNIKDGTFCLLVGTIRPEKRKEIWKKSKFIFATPQTITRDLINNRISLDEVSLMIFDEAHRAVGNYDYVFIAENYAKLEKSHILALTASPGNKKEDVEEICKNLFIKTIEARSEGSYDVKSYVKERKIKKILIKLPKEIKEIKKLLENCLRRRLKILKREGLLKSHDLKKIKKSELIKLQGEMISNGDFSLISKIAACTKIMHCLELLQTQGIKPLSNFITKLKKQYYKVKATRELIQDYEFREATYKIFKLEEKNYEHPKFEILNHLLDPNKKTIIFTNYRDTINRIIEILEKNGIKAKKFIGQRFGMSQKEQIKTLNDFRDGKYNILVSSSIGEEGLDIPNVDRVIFFEPVPSALRTIQRMGRTARNSPGEILLLITKDTIDEKYYWISFHRRKRLEKAIEEIKTGQRRIEEWI